MVRPAQLNLFDVCRYQCVNSRGTVAELETTCGGLVLADAPVSLEGWQGHLSAVPNARKGPETLASGIAPVPPSPSSSRSAMETAEETPPGDYDSSLIARATSWMPA